MAKLKKVRAGDKITADVINALVDAVESLRVIPTKGVDVQSLPSGQALHVKASGKGRGSKGKRDTSGDPTPLACAQNSQDKDTWTAGQDPDPVSVQILTEVAYDEVTNAVYGRYRTFIFNRDGSLRSISAEGDRVVITVAVTCS